MIDGQISLTGGEPVVWFSFTIAQCVDLAANLSVHDTWRTDLLNAASRMRAETKPLTASALSAPIRADGRKVETIEVTDGTT